MASRHLKCIGIILPSALRILLTFATTVILMLLYGAGVYRDGAGLLVKSPAILTQRLTSRLRVCTLPPCCILIRMS